MSAVGIIAIIAVCAIVAGLFLGNMFSLLMIAELDRMKEDSMLDSNFAFTRRASFRTFREYRNSCPGGKLHVYATAGYALTMTGFIGFAACMISLYQPLVVDITSPAQGAAFTAPANIVISANSSEGNHTVSRVDFYQGATLLGSSTTAPYSVTWSNVQKGNYSLTAKATDDRGTTTTSDAVRITVNAPGNNDPLR